MSGISDFTTATNIEKELVTQAKIFAFDIPKYFTETEWLIPNWKWVAIATVFTLGLVLVPLINSYLKFLKNRQSILKRLTSLLQQILKLKIEYHVAWILVCLFWFGSIEALDLSASLEKFLDNVVKFVFAFHAIQTLNLVLEGWGAHYQEKFSNEDNRFNTQLIPFAVKTAKVFIFAFGFLILLQSYGVNVVSLLAGLGVGSLAVALAAQETFANLLGSVNILVDKPFHVGDAIRVGDTEGIVEEVGFRSTRIRTFYNSVISIPNATMAKEKIDNMSMRPARRIRHILGLTYDTSPEKIEIFCKRLKEILLNDPKTARESVLVALTGLGDFALQVTMNFHSYCANPEEEFATQQRVLLDVYKLAAELQIEFAYPTQTVLNKN